MRATRAASTRATPAPHFPARWDGWQRMATRLLLGGGITAILPLRTAYDSAVVGCRYSWAAQSGDILARYVTSCTIGAAPRPTFRAPVYCVVGVPDLLAAQH